MFRALIFVLALMNGVANASPRWSLGAGLEGTVQNGVNPTYPETGIVPQIFGQMLLPRWAGHAELGTRERSSESGGLKITTRSTNFSFWGRYRFFEAKPWRPFASVGLGSYFDQVTSEYKSLRDEREGTRMFAGLGAGVSRVFREHLLLEAEARLSAVREKKEPMFSALLRIGYLF